MADRSRPPTRNRTSSRPLVVVLGGPNGAGKSTAAPRLLKGALRVKEFVNADLIARGLSPFDPEGAALAASEVMLRRMDSLAATNQSFGIESTLATRTLAPRLQNLVLHGYRFHLVFLYLRSAQLAVERVASRVRLGGHSVLQRQSDVDTEPDCGTSSSCTSPSPTVGNSSTTRGAAGWN